MKINGLEGLSPEAIGAELERGAKFVLYKYAISIVILTFQRPSDIYFVRSGESRFAKGLGYTIISLVFGWWGIPWGPIYTIAALVTNLGGGKDVTAEVLAALEHVPGGLDEDAQVPASAVTDE